METPLNAGDIAVLNELNDYLDDPPVAPWELVPEVEKLLTAAWWITEDTIRENTGKCSSTHTRKDEHAPETAAPFTCQCCRYFHQISLRAKALRRHL